MFNHHRGLWGYTGTAADGEALTIQSTGMGGPSAAIVVTELVELGARRLIRVGTCGALDASLALGDLLIVSEAIAGDGTSRALGAGDRVRAAPELLDALGVASGAGVHRGPVASTDLFYGDSREAIERWRAAGARAVEMETATLFALAQKLDDVQAACALIVSDVLLGNRVRIGVEQLREAEYRLGQLGLAGLSRPSERERDPSSQAAQ